MTKKITKVSYDKLSVEQLLDLCSKRIPGFSINLQVYAQPMGGVSMTWYYNFNTAPLWQWSRMRPTEAAMCGTYRSIHECLVTILGRVDRFDTWNVEQQEAKEATESYLRARRAVAAAPVEKPKEIDEGEEEVPAQELEPVTPLPDSLDSDEPVVGKPS